jgi:flavin reductase (DIM6/NTAB) family NADH-FMN oxidoreductase RutF
MIFDPQAVTRGELYRFLISVVVPRPIAFVSTVNERGQFNVAPFSYFNAIASQPPLLGVSINLRSGEPKDTLRNIRAIGDFVINVVNEDLAHRMVEASGDWPEDVSEFELTKLTPVPSDRVKSPRVGESPIAMECRLYREIELGDATFVVGEVVRAHVADDVLVEGRVDIARLKPVGRLGGDGYAKLGEVFHLPRPKVGKPAAG